ncbi:MAG TPA: hypothetical protein VMG10_00540 [Gemmataceae bacterium]|nr:hypothetical protein [Gemmataceae bacterium]
MLAVFALGLAVFVLRLAAGMIGCLLLLPSGRLRSSARQDINPRFFRTHFLTALALAGLALLCVRDSADWLLLSELGTAMVLAFVGSLVWGLEGAPGGRTLIVLTTLTLAGSLAWLEMTTCPVAGATGLWLLGDASSALLLGSALTAMLLGHSYLIAPTMSLTPLMRLLAVLALAVIARLSVDGYALCWTAMHSPVSLKSGDAVFLLPLRWLLGFAAPLGLTWMAWQTARIRSTQSATGILYVVVIFCFLGELTSQLLRGTRLTL